MAAELRAVSLFLAAAVARAMTVREGGCESSLVAYALMTQRVCEFNWALDPALMGTFPDPGVHNPNWPDTEQVDECWHLERYSTDRFMTTAVYQHRDHQQCVLAISGYHGTQNGFMKTILAATSPPEKWEMCNNFMHAPVVKQFRHHTSLENWSSIVNYLANEGSCRDITVTGDSLGGSVAEMLVGCGTVGEMFKLQPEGLPTFSIKAVYTFGAFATSTVPIRNNSAENGCIAGKRIFHEADKFAQWAKSEGLLHPFMDAVKLVESNGKSSYENLRCLSRASYDSDLDTPLFGGPLLRKLKSVRTAKAGVRVDDDVDILSAHAIPHYVKQLRAMVDPPAALHYASLLRGEQFASIREG
mmetsp:Transcript_49795/g.115600  ORF Transcript_49795/g.115600 Transcript_49795/m.115600 type:complete len:358 (-) Transcript_49795:119-1192(-)